MSTQFEQQYNSTRSLHPFHGIMERLFEGQKYGQSRRLTELIGGRAMGYDFSLPPTPPPTPPPIRRCPSWKAGRNYLYPDYSRMFER